MVFRVRSYIPSATGGDVTGSEGRVLTADFKAGHVPAIISSGERARDGFVLEQAGLEFERYRQNPVVLLNHNDGGGGMFGGASSALPIARSRDESFDTSRDITSAVAEFDMDDPEAVRVLGKVERGLINSTSIRWIPLEHRIDRSGDRADSSEPVIVFVRSEVLEWSFVPIPSDPNAVVQRSDGTASAFCVDEACTLLGEDVSRETITSGSDATTLTLSHEFNPMSLVDVVDAANALIDGRSDPVFTEAEQMAAARLYGLINQRVFAARQMPARAADETAGVLDVLAEGMRHLTERQTT